jgi:hypothetical protein
MSQKEKPKKERVLHTRISDALDRELRDKAAELGVSVSKLVRNALLTTVDLVENIVVDSARIAENATNLGTQFGRPETGEPSPATQSPASQEQVFAPTQVIGWQELVLNLNAICVQCNAILPKGTNASVGLTMSGGSGQVICETCLEQIRQSEEADSAE